MPVGGIALIVADEIVLTVARIGRDTSTEVSRPLTTGPTANRACEEDDRIRLS
jgi:hypothetical protein